LNEIKIDPPPKPENKLVKEWRLRTEYLKNDKYGRRQQVNQDILDKKLLIGYKELITILIVIHI
jgi:hypothetical protein